jgi:REP element-mobilizing transposase RayT
MTTLQDAYAYFISIRTYATWLHGDGRGSTDRHHNQFNTAFITPLPALHHTMKILAREPEFVLNKSMRNTVLQSLKKTCHYFGWKIFAIHVRTNHVHIVLQSDITKENTMGKLKSYATRALRKCHPELSSRNHFWSRHGSNKVVFRPEWLFAVLYYVIKEQGEPMALYYDPKYYDLQNEALHESALEG